MSTNITAFSYRVDTIELFLECRGGGGGAGLCISKGSRLGLDHDLHLGSFSSGKNQTDMVKLMCRPLAFMVEGYHILS